MAACSFCRRDPCSPWIRRNRFTNTTARIRARQNGLPADLITGIIQSKDGYIWLGTQKGLVRFDGIEYKLANVPLPKGQSQEIRSLARARDGGIWLSVSRGNFGYYNGQKFDPIEDERWAGSSINSTTIMETSEGAVWTASDDGLGRWVPGNLHDAFFDTNYGNIALSCYEDSHGRVWVGTAEHGLLYWQNGKLIPFPDDSLKQDNIFAVAEDLEGNIWVGTGNNLHCYDSTFHRKQIPPFYNEVRDHSGGSRRRGLGGHPGGGPRPI